MIEKIREAIWFLITENVSRKDMRIVMPIYGEQLLRQEMSKLGMYSTFSAPTSIEGIDISYTHPYNEIVVHYYRNYMYPKLIQVIPLQVDIKS